MPTHRRCVAWRWLPTAATVLAAPSATASTPPTRPRPAFGWSTPRAPGTCASAAAATCPRAPSRALLLQERRKPRALTPSPATAGEGWGGVPLGIASNRGHPLPASPCRGRGRGQDKSSRLEPLLQEQHP